MRTYDIFTRSHDAFRNQLADLTARAERGELAKEGLSEAIDRYYDDRDYIDRSIGTAWILDHPELFARVVPEAERYEFLVAHLDRPHCAELLICDQKALETLPQEKRADYVCEAFSRCGARNNSWIRAAQAGGVSKSDLAIAVELRLEEAKPSQERSHCTAFTEFLRDGDQGRSFGRAEHLPHLGEIDNPSAWRVPEDSPWGVCGRSQFRKLVSLCAQKAPHLVFENWRKLRAKLPVRDINDLLAEAAAHLERYPDSIEGLLRLGQDAREALLRRLAPTFNDKVFIDFLARTATAAADPLAVYQEHASNLDVFDVDLVEAFQTTVSLPVFRDGHPVTREIKARFRRRLEAEGYRIGTVVRKTYWNRKMGREQSQLCVELGRMRYVEERSSHRYAAREGDEVLFLIGGRHLTPDVVVVYFDPTDAAKYR